MRRRRWELGAQGAHLHGPLYAALQNCTLAFSTNCISSGDWEHESPLEQLLKIIVNKS